MQNSKCNLLIDHMNDPLKKISTESAEGTEIHQINQRRGAEDAEIRRGFHASLEMKNAGWHGSRQ